jgi:hypothetical protein
VPTGADVEDRAVASLKRAPAVAAALALLLAGLAPGLELISRPPEPAYVAAPAAVPADTVAGWVVDANDWLDRGLLGVRHRGSAVTSADLGEPLVILTDNGSIVYPVSMRSPSGPMMDNIRLMPFAEQRVVVTGRFVARDRERGIVVDRIAGAAGAVQTGAFPVRETPDSKLIGRVTALSCWLGRTDTGLAHARCARDHADAGEPLIIVSDSVYMYYPVVRDTMTDPPDFTKLFRYIEQKVVVTGTVINRGRARGIAIKSVAEFTPDRSSETIRPGDQR